MKKFLLVLLLAGLAVSCSSKGGKEDLLFILHADYGVYRDGQLVLRNVSPAVGYFADRPIRKGGTMDLPTFLNSWNEKEENNFTKDPPNAGFVYYANFGTAYSECFVELKNPQYNEFSRTLVFDIYIVDGTYPWTNQELKEIYLFVDALKARFTPHKGYNAKQTQQSALKCNEDLKACLGTGTDGKSAPTAGTYKHCESNPSKACDKIYKQYGNGGPSSSSGRAQQLLERKKLQENQSDLLDSTTEGVEVEVSY